MSFDFQLAWPCPHLTLEEVVSLGSDRKSLACRQPVSAVGTIRLMVNNEFFIPQGGLYMPGRLHSTDSGPFSLVENEDVFTVTSSLGSETFSFGVVGTNRLTTDELIKHLQQNNISVATVENRNGHLCFTDTSKVGVDSFVGVTGTAAASLGFGSAGVNGRQRRAVGRMLYPGWELATREDTITNRYPRFLQPIKTNPIFKVSYAVHPSRCLRCNGTYVENDIRYDHTGQTIIVENENLLYQEVLKILLTDIGSNPYHTWYGTSIRKRIGAKAVGGVSALISEDVRKALLLYQKLQEKQSDYQPVTFKERMYTVAQVKVSPHVEDPTTFLVEVTVQNASNEPINLSIVFTVPGVVALMGTNGLMLGNEPAGLTDKTAKLSALFGRSDPRALPKASS